MTNPGPRAAAAANRDDVSDADRKELLRQQEKADAMRIHAAAASRKRRPPGLE